MSKVLGGVSCDKADCLTALNITDWNVHKVQGDQLNMAVFFLYLVKSDFSSTRFSYVYTGQVPFYKVPEKTRPCLIIQLA